MPFFSLAVAMAAYDGIHKASWSIVADQCQPQGVEIFLMKMVFYPGKGYYAFIHVGNGSGLRADEPMGQYLAEEHGLAVVPGLSFRPMAVIGSASPMRRHLSGPRGRPNGFWKA
jgi:hypothetical protein